VDRRPGRAARPRPVRGGLGPLDGGGGRAAGRRGRSADPALILEAPYPDLVATVGAWLARLRLPRALAGPLVLRAGALAGVSLARPRPIDLAPRVGVPVLILHGTDDPIIPPAEVRRLAAAFPRPAAVVEVAGARHGDVFDVGGPELMERIAAFLAGVKTS
jgi:pimeloyl-ACP methyl ester carboxylesterase